jgi:hypothetical protein
MPLISIFRTVTERVRIDSADLADTTGIDEAHLLRVSTTELSAYVSDFCEDGDTSLFDGAEITDEQISAVHPGGWQGPIPTDPTTQALAEQSFQEESEDYGNNGDSRPADSGICGT